MTFIDLFAGVGGFRKGLENAGHKCVGFCEFDEYAVASYTAMHLITEEQRVFLMTLDKKKRAKEILKDEYRNGEWFAADIRLVTGKNVPRCDCWCFGAPCQDFSIAGTRAGLEGDRSSLVREVFRVLRELEEDDRPEWLIYENVKGMLSSNRGRDYLSILLEMDECGYDAEWFNFNSKYHGVPQNRERVYTIGHLRSRGSAKVFPLKGADGEDRVEGMISENNPKFAFPVAYDGYSGYIRQDQNTGAITQHSGRWGVTNGQKVVLPVMAPDRIEKKQNGRRIKENGDPAFTLTSEDRHGVAIGVQMSGNELSDNNGTASCLNANDQRKVFGANQERTMVGVLRTVRSEYGKEIRKDYESGNLDISRHKFLEHEIREDEVANTIDSVTKDNLLGIGIEGSYNPNGCASGQIVSRTGVSPTVMENHGTVAAVTVRVKEATKQGYAVVREGRDSINLQMPESRTRRGRVGVDMANTLDTSCNQSIVVETPNGVHAYAVWYPKRQCYVAIRKLTPRECFRLQGWEDEYFERAAMVNSDSQLYKQAGNGVTVNVVEVIGKRLKEIENEQYLQKDEV